MWHDERNFPKSMSLNDYQDQASDFARYNKSDYPFAALGEEAGEVLGKLAKYGRKNDRSICEAVEIAANTENQLREDLKKELGDVLWQLTACCTELGFGLEEVARENLYKLSGRAERGTIVGEGDER